MIKKIAKFVRYVQSAIVDPERDFSERSFLALTIISEIAVLIAFIFDIILREHIGEIIVLIAVLVSVPLISFVCLYINKLKFAIRLVVLSLVLGILPALFFFGGGTQGGGFIWFIFGFIYIGLVMTGNWRKAMFILLFIVASVCYGVEYTYPDLISGHSSDVFYVDNFISLILVGIVCFFMTWFQNRMFKAENARARKAADTAEELTRSQNRFFSSMSHEIRTPINSILGLNELILRDASISDEVAGDASGIQGAGKLLLALINDILDFSKMEAGSMEIVPVDYHLGDMLSEIVNMIWIKAQDKGLKFEVSVDPKVPTVLYGDEVRIKQIIINLLNNAIKYTKEGSVELHVDSENNDGETTTLSVSVTDTGIGITKEAIPFLFDAFKRVDEEKNRHIEGTGLGLSIVKQLAELMGGNVTVSSVYGEGSTFTFTVSQGVSDATEIGELSIHNQISTKRNQYEASFKAPEARVLIVDDNEMNLEVEKKLLSGTDITIDTVLSAKDALDHALKYHYDVILMDHLMPVMDGIECLEALRRQSGGLNRTTPVVVLTANAGSANRELYNRSGFDGYLVKPVSGQALEEMLIRHIPNEKLILSGKMMRMREDINTTAGYARKVPVILATSSMSDIPDAVIKKLNIPVLPFRITTENGVFKDGVQMEANELIRYLNSGKSATSSPPDVKTVTDFFADVLKKAHHIIYIALSTSMSEDYIIASEAAKSFDDVTVINSGCLSSATGILTLIGIRLAQQSIPVDEIVSELETVKERLRCSFVIDTTEYMARNSRISPLVHKVAKALSFHPSLKFKDDKYGLGGIWIGSTQRAYRQYIKKAFPVDIIPDSDVVFITYADVPLTTLMRIKEEISKLAYFEHVVFKQASAAISSNCGPGAFGILYFVKSNKSYNIGSYFDDEDKVTDDPVEDWEETETGEEAETVEEGREVTEIEDPAIEEAPVSDEKSPLNSIEGLDAAIGIKNSGSEEAFMTVLKIFYDSMAPKEKELNGYLETEDWQNYTIKIHALKSSAKLIGAMPLSEKAYELEMAGKEGNVEFIKDNHEAFFEDFKKLKEPLSLYFDGDKSENETKEDTRPLADASLMESVYDALKEAAEAMDCDAIDDVWKELEGYALPDDEAKKLEGIREKADNFDYDGILELLNG